MENLDILQIDLLPGLILRRYVFLVYADCFLQPGDFQTLLIKVLPPWARYFGGRQGRDVYSIVVDLNTTAIDVPDWLEAFRIGQSRITVFAPFHSERIGDTIRVVQEFIETKSDLKFGRQISPDSVHLGEGCWTAGINTARHHWKWCILRPCWYLKKQLPSSGAWFWVVSMWQDLRTVEDEIKLEDCITGHCEHARAGYSLCRLLSLFAWKLKFGINIG